MIKIITEKQVPSEYQYIINALKSIKVHDFLYDRDVQITDVEVKNIKTKMQDKPPYDKLTTIDCICYFDEWLVDALSNKDKYGDSFGSSAITKLRRAIEDKLERFDGVYVSFVMYANAMGVEIQIVE